MANQALAAPYTPGGGPGYPSAPAGRARRTVATVRTTPAPPASSSTRMTGSRPSCITRHAPLPTTTCARAKNSFVSHIQSRGARNRSADSYKITF